MRLRPLWCSNWRQGPGRCPRSRRSWRLSAPRGHDLGPAAGGDARALAARLDRAVLPHRQPSHLACRGRGLRAAGPSSWKPAPTPPFVSVAAALRRSALEAWRLLARERTYLRGILERIARREEAAEIDDTIVRRPAEVLAGWVREAQPALLSGAPRGAVMLRVLRELERETELAHDAREARESLLEALLSPLRLEDHERLAPDARTRKLASSASRRGPRCGGAPKATRTSHSVR